MSGTISADVLLDYFDSGAGPIPGPYGVSDTSSPTPVDPSIIVDADTGTGSLSLPTGSYVTVGFSGAGLVDRPGDDIAVTEFEDAGESAEVYVSSDGSNFALLGVAGGGTTSLDLASIGLSGPIEAVRVVGLDLGGNSPGFDLLNVQALQATIDVDLGPNGNLRAVDPVWISTDQTLRFGFEVESLPGFPFPIFPVPAPDDVVRAAASVVPVKLFLGTVDYSDGSVDLGRELPTPAAQGPFIDSNRVLYAVPAASVPLSLSDEDLDANAIVAVVDSDDRVEEATEIDNQASLVLPFVVKIPQIMRNIGDEWDVAAGFQERWLGNKADVIQGTPGAAVEAGLASAVEPVALDWVLRDTVDTDGRARAAFDRLADVDYLFNDAARGVLESKLAERLGDAPVGTVVLYGAPAGSDPEDLLGAQTQVSAVETGGVIDPLTGALGNFSFYAIPRGQAEKVSEAQILFTAEGVDIFVADVFEFNGFQYLGSWRPPAEVRTEPDLSLSYAPIFNSSYGGYRDQTGLGEDFLVLSDVASEELRQGGAPISPYLVTVDL